MIAFLKGKVAALREDEVQVDVNGVGFSVLVPINTFKPLPALEEEIMLFTHLQIREDAWQLFGFLKKEQLDIFRQLISVSGIGAKTALGIINSINSAAIIKAVAHNDVNIFCTAPGVGKKTAQRLVLELKDKLGKWALDDGEGITPEAISASFDSDLLAALSQLGYSPAESRSLAMKAMQKLGPEADSGSLLKEALKLSLKH